MLRRGTTSRYLGSPTQAVAERGVGWVRLAVRVKCPHQVIAEWRAHHHHQVPSRNACRPGVTHMFGPRNRLLQQRSGRACSREQRMECRHECGWCRVPRSRCDSTVIVIHRSAPVSPPTNHTAPPHLPVRPASAGLLEQRYHAIPEMMGLAPVCRRRPVWATEVSPVKWLPRRSPPSTAASFNLGPEERGGEEERRRRER